MYRLEADGGSTTQERSVKKPIRDRHAIGFDRPWTGPGGGVNLNFRRSRP